MNNNAPLVSVIIPVYNGEKTIRKTLDSALNQSWSNIEIIVVDDGSSDGTVEILKSYGDQINYFRQANQGVSAARNLGIDNAKGAYIAFLDADDVWISSKVAYQIEVFNKYPEVQLCYCKTEFNVTDFDLVLSKMKNENIDKPTIKVYNDLSHIFLNPFLSTSSVMVNADTAKTIDGFDRGLITAEDIDFYFRVCRDNSYACLEHIMMLKGDSPDSLGSKLRSYPDYLFVIKNFVKRNSDFAAKHSQQISEKIEQVYEEWIRELLCRGFGAEARRIIKKAKEEVRLNNRKVLWLKSLICRLTASLKGKAEKFPVSYN